MCEILAVNAARSVRANDHLHEFFPDSVWHPHGWGLAWRDGGKVRLHKEPVRAIDSELLARLLEADICSSMLVAHIRNATRGAMAYENCHPFLVGDATGRTWIVAHNGTVLSDALIEPFRAVQEGTTDSERLALFLMSRIDEAVATKGGSLSPDERFTVLDKAIVDLAPGNKLNLVLDDGELTYVHTNTSRASLYHRLGAGQALLCSRPIGDGWQPIPSCQLVAYRDGEVTHGYLARPLLR